MKLKRLYERYHNYERYVVRQVYPGGYNGTSATTFNSGGGGWATPSTGGYQGVLWSGALTASTVYPTGGTALQGGNGSFAVNFNNGGGGGGGYYGGGGGSTGANPGGGGGGSNYANASIVTGISYGTITTNSNANLTPINGYVTFSW